MRTIIIGDIHGCLGELKSLLESIGPEQEDRFAFLGDLVDRGPDSAGVVAFVRKLVATHPGSVCLMGNHEDKLLRKRQRGDSLPDWAGNLSGDDWHFLAPLPLLHSVPEHGAILVHGGMYPRYFEHYDTIREIPSDWWSAKDKRADRERRFLRIRRVNEKGDMVSLYQSRPDFHHWSHLYDGRAGFCFFGHDAQLHPPEILRAPHATGLDTACCFGGTLTAAILEPGMPARDAKIVSVASREAYAPFREDDD